MKKEQISLVGLLAVIAFITFIMGSINAKEQKLTSSISWEVSEDGTLRIQGTGTMPDFEFDKPKYWRKKEYEGKINKIVIGEGITAIGNYSFDNCSLFKGNSFVTVHSVEFPSTLTEIGLGAFTGNHIHELVLPAGLRIIRVGAFKRSWLLKNVTVSSPELQIGSGAFEDCPKLEEIDFNNSKVTLSKLAFSNDKALVSVRNAANVGYAPGLVLADVFKNTPLKSLDEGKDFKEQSASLSSCPVPDGEWDIEYADGGQVYAGEYIRLNFNGTLAANDLENGVEAPFGYMSSWDDQGGSSFLKFSTPEILGDKVKVTGSGYTDDGEERTNMVTDYIITYDKTKNSVTLHHPEDPDSKVEYLDIDRLRIPEDVFNKEYTGRITYEDRGEDIISVNLYRDGKKVVMQTVLLHPFMAPPTVVTFYSGTIDGHEIKFTRKIEELVYNIQEENALDLPCPDWKTIDSTGDPCDNTITHYTSCLYLDSILLEP